jgi:hypothetical protein
MIDSHGTFIAGYVAATVIYFVYTLTLWRRARRVREKLAAHGKTIGSSRGA